MGSPGRAVAATEAAFGVIDDREPAVHAWAHLDRDRALREARAAPGGRLGGLTLGVKDIFDTGDQPTEYGSPIYAGYRPRADAAVVAQLRAAGAVVLGKTVTTELAYLSPGPTTNPHRATHTPGGSSSGSAAAVAAGMVDLALGTQTAGSIIRPASFCGVLGLKPTFGLVSTAGTKPGAPSLDTVGLLVARFVVLEAALGALVGNDLPTATADPRFAFVRTDQWEDADPDCREVIERAAAAVGAIGRDLPEPFIGLADAHVVVQAFEYARSFAWERSVHPDLLSAVLREVLDFGDQVTVDEYTSVLARAALARSRVALDALFGQADVLVTPAVVGEAPEGLSSTGAPRFNRLWTLLGLPCLTVPGFVGSTGLPIGVQLVARPYREATLFPAGRRLMKLAFDRDEPATD